MEVMSNKRPAENDESIPVKSIAVCPSCNRISNDLKACEHCSAALSEDNSTTSYSSEPKRIRTVATLSEAIDTAVENGLNTDASTSTNAVRPETLFRNVNNQAVPVLLNSASVPRPVVPGSSQAVPSAMSSVEALRRRALAPSTSNSSTSNLDAANANGVAARTIVGTVNLNSRLASESPVTVVGTSVLGQARPSLAPASTNSSDGFVSRPATSTQIVLPTYNLQPPPPPLASTVTPYSIAVGSSTVRSAVPMAGAALSQNVMLSAIQIRIGSKKFKPFTAVTFQDDGILITLKDYAYAPVLLNARAIIKCKANLNVFSYPVLFLFLENSCMRQIRQIFGVSMNEFASTSDVEMKRCISIFPVFGNDSKQQVQQLMFSIKRSFDAMIRRYPRSSQIVEEITNDAVIDMLLEGTNKLDSMTEKTDTAVGTTTVAASASSVRSPAVTAAPGVAGRTSVGTTLMTTSSSLANGSTPSHGERPSEGQAGANRAVAQGGTVATSSVSSVSAPLLVLPNDANRWQTMQKNLVAGGVYHVLALDKSRQYCVWNGNQLVPCQVQNTEVTLESSRIRIGLLSAECKGQVRIKADFACGVYFTMLNEKSGLQEIFLPVSDISSLQICIGRLSVMFITLNHGGGEKLNNKFKPFVNEPVIDLSGSAEVMKQYVLIFLHNINHDQEEAMKQMKIPGGGSTSALSVIDPAHGLQLLAMMRINSSVSSELADYLSKNNLSGAAGFERLALEIKDYQKSGVTTVDDDDDDVIMTQEELGIKCPYTQKVMEEPVRNIICNHNYEKVAIQEFIVRKKGNAKCPYAGCGNAVPLRMEDLEDNKTLKEYIVKNSGKSNSQSTLS